MKRALTVFLAILMVAALASCGGNTTTTTASSAAADSAAASTAAADTGDTIKIGYISDLTGSTSVWGQAGLNGAKLAVEDVNAAGGVLGKKIEVVPMDGKGDPADSVSAYKKLVEESKIVASVGTNFSSCNIPMAAVADELHVPILGTAASNELVTIDESGKLHPYSFRMCFIDSFQGTVVGTYAAKNLSYKTGAMLTVAGNAYSEGVGSFIKTAFEKNGAKMVASEQCQDADTDFRAQLSNIKSQNPDVLFIIMTDYSKIALVAQQARELGMKCQFMGTDGWDSAELAKAANGALEGSYYLSRIGFNSDAAAKFGERYKSVYNIDLEGECLFGYDGIMWVVDALKRANSTDPVAVRDALENTDTFTGLIGTLVMDAKTHNPAMDCAIYTCKGDKFEFKEIVKASDIK